LGNPKIRLNNTVSPSIKFLGVPTVIFTNFSSTKEKTGVVPKKSKEALISLIYI
jgi:hypothetical protein